jgi:hypothetical protein
MGSLGGFLIREEVGVMTETREDRKGATEGSPRRGVAAW